MFLCSGRGTKERKITGSNTSIQPQEKPMSAKWKPNVSLVVLENYSLLNGKEIQQLVQKHVFLLMRLPPAPQEIWLSKTQLFLFLQSNSCLITEEIHLYGRSTFYIIRKKEKNPSRTFAVNKITSSNEYLIMNFNGNKSNNRK